MHGCRDVELVASDTYGGDVEGWDCERSDFLPVLVVLLYARTAPNGDVEVTLVVDVHAVRDARSFDSYDVLIEGYVSVFVVKVPAYFTCRCVDEEQVVLIKSDAVGNACAAD